ncbi:DNA (cytosine-5)-methyltransferase 1 [Streptomyces sp. DvalAA-14]|uniref:DNA cytosine methyltransferase n=1 Tax=unclassified Streptomyces TaxID=2593676 RepID=UPI00081B032A|nr:MULTISPECIES: DNA cytosine methyltransferase [unclassified Streptomyces]MYS22795.1 DNA cytosine methyltransferase [Streptomyces sp. SID4948]SCE22541.1 DNA (cytosine-5)-methyltransferase 1 [Streptomyces sp. DvalAA-14]
MHSPDDTVPPEIIDLFAGPGGLDMAAHALRLPVTGIEFDDDACATRRMAGLATVSCDVRERGPADYPNARVLAGGPPCQTFTVAGSGSGRRALEQVLEFARRMADGEDIRPELDKLDDERTGLVLEPLRWALEAIGLNRPYETVVLEQVPAVLPVWKAFEAILQEHDYSVVCGVLHTEEFGVPQTRRRAVLIGRLRNNETLTDEVALPEPTHQRFRKNDTTPTGQGKRTRCVTMGDVLKKRHQPFEVVSNYGTGGDPRARGRRAHDEPAFTVTGKISRNRVFGPGIKAFGSGDGTRFENYEAGVLQTFPERYPWSGRAVAQQIGNAIPPRLGIHILAAALGLGAGEVTAALQRLKTWAPPLPAPHPTGSAPA